VWETGVFGCFPGVHVILNQLRRNRGFLAAAVLILAVGIAANTSVFSLIYATLLRPLPYKRPDQLLVLWASIPQKGIPADWTSWPTIQDWRKQSTSFQDVAVELRVTSAILTGPQEPEPIKVGRVSANLFPLLGIQPILGRTFTPEEEFRREPLVVISSRFWRTKFASSLSAIGSAVEVDHKRATIVGVMPDEFAFPSAGTQVWLPLSFVPQWFAFLSARQSDGFRAIARLKAGVTLKQAQSEMNVIAQRLAKQHPDTDAGKGIVLVPLAKQLIDGHLRSALWMLFGAVVLVLLVGCSNVASLLLAKGAARRREFAIRTALGASRFRVIRQMMGESFAVAAISTALGLEMAALVQHALVGMVPPDLAAYAKVGLSLPMLALAVLLSVATALLFGFAPAWRLSVAEPAAALKTGCRTQAGHRSRSRMQSALIVGEFALTAILLSGTGLLVRSFLLLQQEKLGFTPENLLLANVRLAHLSFEDVLQRVRAVPGVKDAAATGSLFSDYRPDTAVITEESAYRSHSDQTAPAALGIVTETFFQTLRIPLLRGRLFSEQDGPTHPPVAVINQSMADQFWPGQNPIGKRFRYGMPGALEPEWLNVIGIVRNINPYGPGSQVISTFYRPYRQAAWPSDMDIIVRCSTNNCAALENTLRQTIRSADPQVPRFAVQRVTSILEQMSAPRRLQIRLLGVFSGIALCLATAGIYGLLSYLVSQRTQEIGIRMALGATGGDVLRLVITTGVRLAGIGTFCGLGASLLLTRFIRHLLFGVTTSDPTTISLVAVTLLIAAFTASYFPARRATRVDPLSSIRHE
jgi:predicted permease